MVVLTNPFFDAPTPKLKRPDLTPRQIEWCRAHIFMFAEMQRLRGVK